MEEKYEIKNLHELVELGLKLHKQNIPNGFIVTVWAKKEDRIKIFKELLDNKTDVDVWKIENKLIDCYNFKILGINFLLF